MSRAYDFQVEITGIAPKRVEAVKQACIAYGPFKMDDSSFEAMTDDSLVTEQVQGALCGGQTEEEYVNELSAAVWKANKGKYCQIHVMLIYLEESPPVTEHIREKDDYNNWKRKQRKGKSHVARNRR